MSSESEAARPAATGNATAGNRAAAGEAHITVRNLTMAYGEFVVMHDLNFVVRRGEIFIIMGGSGSGKSTLLRNLMGLEEPAAGEVLYGRENFTQAGAEQRKVMLRRCGVLYQNGALWSSMTLRENVALPLAQFTDLAEEEIREVAGFKLALVGLKNFEESYPAEISGGMQKRAAVARAIALDPEMLFFDEPSAGLDPVTSSLLDELILELRANLGATVVVVTHELASILEIGDNSVFLDGESKTMIAQGKPKELLARCADERVQRFLTRGRSVAGASHAG
ncbi:MAG TPA: ATP-binding cassette domain-containing protein [Candidatus Binataceae bacterium]|nr:ATP-binding cassette domain-containing protein [Candidatus Binataceae bacterium]